MSQLLLGFSAHVWISLALSISLVPLTRLPRPCHLPFLWGTCYSPEASLKQEFFLLPDWARCRDHVHSHSLFPSQYFRPKTRCCNFLQTRVRSWGNTLQISQDSQLEALCFPQYFTIIIKTIFTLCIRSLCRYR